MSGPKDKAYNKTRYEGHVTGEKKAKDLEKTAKKKQKAAEKAYKGKKGS